MDDPSSSKRRRGLGVVTPNACTECRKKRAKCDGQEPCGRCASQKSVQCIYEVPVRQTKENMRTEIEHLRAQQQSSDRVLQALVSNEQAEQVLEKLRSGESVKTVSEQLEINKGKHKVSGTGDNVTTFTKPSDFQSISGALKTARSIGSSPLSTLAFSDTYAESAGTGSWGQWGGEGNPSSHSQHQSQGEAITWSPEVLPSQSQQGFGFPLVGTWHHQQEGSTTLDDTTQNMRSLGAETILGQDFGWGHQRLSTSWSNITSDQALMEHLMALYFCWEYPTFASLSKEHFLEDYRLGSPRHCSSLLVNALLAVGCRFSTQVGTRADPSDGNTAGDHFFAEAVRLLTMEDSRHKLTTVQALGLMSIREASCGRSSEGLYYSGQSIRLAIEMGLHTNSQSGGGDYASYEHAVRSATFWGAFALDQCWSLCIGRLPHFSRDTQLIPKPAIVDHVEATPWIPYTDDGDGLPGLLWQQQLTGSTGAPLERNCTQPSNVRSVYKTFCELSEIVHKAHYTFYSPGIKLTGKALLEVYTQYLQWYDSIPEALRLGHNFTPAVLFAHMYYHFAILLLFRPFIKLEIVGSGVSPRDVCAQAADALQTLVNSYAQLYTLRRTPSFVPYFVLAASITHLVTHGTGRSGPEAFNQCVLDLKNMAGCHGFASRAHDILQFLAEHWEVPIEMEPSEDRTDVKVKVRPHADSFNQFCPNIESVDMVSTIAPIENQEQNPLFWPFPTQGRPLIGTGEELERAGFRGVMPAVM